MIRASGLAKYFGGKRALGPVSLEIGRGETIGFLGLNGVGKTTALRIVAGDLRPSAGQLLVNGIDAVRNPLAVRRLVGFLPEQPPLYPDMTAADFLAFAGRVRKMSSGAVERRVAELEELIALGDVRNELIRNLSQGYRQRVGLAQALIHEPQLLILDEPAHDLDPAQIVEMRSLVRDLSNRHTILVSSHNLPEISETCDRLLVLHQGRIIASGTEKELSARWLGAQRIEVTVRAPVGGAEAGAGALDPEGNGAADAVRRVEGIRQVTSAGPDGEGIVLEIDSEGDRRAEVCRALVENGYDVLRLERARQRLENVFLDLIHGAEGAGDTGHTAA